MALPAHSQTRSYIHYTTANGLPANELYNGVQTEEGYLLFNSAAGLIRFDGYEFQQYGTGSGLPDIELIGSYKDVYGRVWIRPFKSRLCYYRHGKIYNEHNDPLVKWITTQLNSVDLINYNQNEEQTLVMGQAHNNRVFVVGRYGSYSCQLPMKPGEVILAMLPVGRQVYVATNEKMYLAGRDGAVAFALPQDFALKEYRVIMHRNRLYCTELTKAGFLDVSAFEFDGHQLRHLKTLHLDRYKFETTPSGLYTVNHRLLLCNKNCVYELDSGLTQIKIIARLPEKNIIGGVLIDDQKNLWLTTTYNGLFLFPGSAFPVFNGGSGVEEDDIKRVYADQRGITYFGTSHYIYNLDPVKGTLHSYPLYVPPDAQQRLMRITPRGSKLYFQYRPLRIWVYDTAGHTTAPFPAFLGGGDIKDMQLQDSMELYACTHGVYMIQGSKETTLYGKRATCIYYDSLSSVLYIGTLNGMLKYEFRTQAVTDLSITGKIPGERITSLCRDEQGILWAATSANGIFAIRGDSVLAHVHERNGLVSDIVNALHVASGQGLLVATNKGLNILTSHADGHGLYVDSIATYNMDDGLPDNFINDAAYHNGRLSIATAKGVCIISTQTALAVNANRVIITKTIVNGRELPADSLTELGGMPYLIQIKYSGLNYGNRSTHYKYRLLPGNTGWLLTEEYSKEFGPLTHGNYTFEIVVVDKNGRPVSPVTRLPIIIKPTFWQTNLFKVLCALIVIGIVAWIIRYNLQIRHKKAEVRRNLTELRIKALKAQMNPHFIFNCLHTIQGFINSGNNLESNRFITRFAHLIRQTLHFSDEPFILLSEEIVYLGNYITLEQTRFSHCFEYAIEVAEPIDAAAVRIPSMLIQPFVENAIRHGLRNQKNAAFLEIRFSIEADCLVVAVDDNGVGRSQNPAKQRPAEYQSKGIRLTEDRINAYSEIMGRKIPLEIIDKKHDDGGPAGTCVILKIPL